MTNEAAAHCALCAKPTRISAAQTQGLKVYHAQCAEVIRPAPFFAPVAA